MILKVAHIAFNTDSIGEQLDFLVSKGYKKSFVEKLKNLKMKEKLLTYYQPNHTLVLLEKPGAFSIELVDHGRVNAAEGYIDLIDEKTIAINSNNILESMKLFKNLGFKEQSENTMSFSSVFSGEELYVKFNKTIGEAHFYKLNDKGYSYLAFITTSVDKEKKMLDSLGLQTTEIQELVVNSKKLKLFFAQRANNELIEFIEIKG